jgi:hypothetical protein
MPDADESPGQGVEQEAMDKLDGMESHDPDAFAAGVVPPFLKQFGDAGRVHTAETRTLTTTKERSTPSAMATECSGVW